jgi:hypothetical protein
MLESDGPSSLNQAEINGDRNLKSSRKVVDSEQIVSSAEKTIESSRIVVFIGPSERCCR